MILVNTSLHDKIIPYKIFEKQGIKIGVLGYGIELKGLVDKKMYKETIYQDPLPIANATAKLLKLGFRLRLCDCFISFRVFLPRQKIKRYEHGAINRKY
jgi:5'-nucleotidase